MFLGPMFPILMSHSSQILPRGLVTVCMGWIVGVGVVGAAALPGIAGVLAQKFGIAAIQPWSVCS